MLVCPLLEKKMEHNTVLKYHFARTAENLSDRRWLDVPVDAEIFTCNQKHVGQALLDGLILAVIAEATAIHFGLSSLSFIGDWFPSPS
jgi:hypothetical protein